MPRKLARFACSSVGEMEVYETAGSGAAGFRRERMVFSNGMGGVVSGSLPVGCLEVRSCGDSEASRRVPVVLMFDSNDAIGNTFRDLVKVVDKVVSLRVLYQDLKTKERQ